MQAKTIRPSTLHELLAIFKVAEILELFQDRLKPNAKCLILGSENGYLPILMAHIVCFKRFQFGLNLSELEKTDRNWNYSQP